MGRRRELGIASMMVIAALALCMGLAGCYGQSANKQAAAKPSASSAAQEAPVKVKKTYSDIPTPYPALYWHDPESCWLNVYDEGKVIGYPEAYDHVGQDMTVEGDIDSVVYSSSSNGTPHFFNLGGGAYAPGGFAVVIWGEDLSRFDQYTLRNYVEWSKSDQPITSRLRVSGTIEMYNGRPQITAREGSQVAIKTEDGAWFAMMPDDDVMALMDAIYR